MEQVETVQDCKFWDNGKCKVVVQQNAPFGPSVPIYEDGMCYAHGTSEDIGPCVFHKEFI